MNIEWVREIERLVRSGRRVEAQSQFDERAQRTPRNAYVLLARSVISRYMDCDEESLKAAEEALEAARLSGDKVAEANSLRTQADALYALNRYEDSLNAARAALEAARASGDKVAEASSLRSQSATLFVLDSYEDSLSTARAALEAARASGDKVEEAKSLARQAAALHVLGRHEESLRMAGAALEAARVSGDKRTRAHALRVEADALRSLDRDEEALVSAGAALEISRDIGDKRGEAHALRIVADALQRLGRYEEALRTASALVDAARAEGDKNREANALRIQADTLRKLARYEESLSAARASLEAARAARNKVNEANALRSQADALFMLGRHEDSLSTAGAALEAARAIHYRSGQINALLIRVLSLSELGESDARARALKELWDLDPPRAQRVATYPARPGWYRKVRHIFEQTEQREEEQRQVLNAEPFEPLVPEGFSGALYVLRNWASYTTVDLMRPFHAPRGPGRWQAGGGYLLWWQGWGLVIDPGLGFGEAFRAAQFLPRNISAVVATHHHIDHTGDMLPILTCLFEMNQQPPCSQRSRHDVDFLLAPSAFSAFAEVAAYVPGVRSLRLLRPGESAELSAAKNNKATVTAVKTEHRDLTGRIDAGIGLRVDLCSGDGKKCSVGFSGDTRFTRGAATAFRDVDLMTIHIGSIYACDIGHSDTRPWHLGFSGTVHLLEEIKHCSTEEWDPLVLISEWGEELRPDRSDICDEIAKSAGIRRVFPAEWKQCVALQPGRAQPVCARNDGKLAHRWHETDSGYIEYLCADHDHG